jgi:peptidylprolyl isomerase
LIAEALRTPNRSVADMRRTPVGDLDPYGPLSGFWDGWVVATNLDENVWPVHCYASVGVARSLSPNTGTGSELYAVIGHAPRQLDRNIAVVGRVIEGIEHLSTLPRGKGEAGVYDDPALRVPIVSVRLGNEAPEFPSASSSEAIGQSRMPRFEYLATESESFARYVEVRANRNDAFYKVPAGGIDVCNVQVPIRRVPGD